MHGNVLLADLAAGVGHGVIDDQVQIDRLGLELIESGFERGHLDQVVYQAADPFGGGFDALHKFTLQRTEDPNQFAEEQVCISHDGRHRLAQFLRNGGNHLSLFRRMRNGRAFFCLDDTHVGFGKLILQTSNLFQRETQFIFHLGRRLAHPSFLRT